MISNTGSGCLLHLIVTANEWDLTTQLLSIVSATDWSHSRLIETLTTNGNRLTICFNFWETRLVTERKSLHRSCWPSSTNGWNIHERLLKINPSISDKILFGFQIYVVAHFHFVLSLGAVIAIFSGVIFNGEKIVGSKNLLPSSSSCNSLYHLVSTFIGILLTIKSLSVTRICPGFQLLDCCWIINLWNQHVIRNSMKGRTR